MGGCEFGQVKSWDPENIELHQRMKADWEDMIVRNVIWSSARMLHWSEHTMDFLLIK